MEPLWKNVTTYRHGKKTLYDIFTKFLNNANMELVKIEDSHVAFANKFTINKNGQHFELHLILKNLCDSGWKEKPWIKRIQIGHIENLPETTEKQAFMLAGIGFYNDKPLFVLWNGLRYIYHKTIRSAYVDVSSLEKALQKGYHYCNDYNNEIFICTEQNFEILFNKYFDFSYIEKIDI